MTEKHFCLSTFLIKYFRFQFIFYVKIATSPPPPQKTTPIFPTKPPLKIKVLSSRGEGAHYDGDNKTILKHLEKQFVSVIKLKPNLYTTCIERRDRETDRNGSFY